MREQLCVAGAPEAGGESVVLGDVGVHRVRHRHRGRGERHRDGVDRAAQQMSCGLAAAGAGQELSRLDRAEPVPVEHPDDADAAVRPALDGRTEVT